MQLCFDATRFGFGLKEAVELAHSKKLNSVEFAFEPFETTSKSAALSAEEKQYLKDVSKASRDKGVEIACLRLNLTLDVEDKKELKSFRQMAAKLSKVAVVTGAKRIVFGMRPGKASGWTKLAEEGLNPVIEDLQKADLKLLLSLATPPHCRSKSLRDWRPLEPQEWRDLLAGCPGLWLSFSPADCAWQNIDYLQILPGLVAAIAHVEANDFEINRTLLHDSGLFGPLWWRYRRPGKGQVDWRQFIEALKLYDYKENFSICLDDEFVEGSYDELVEALDQSVTLFEPLLRY